MLSAAISSSCVPRLLFPFLVRSVTIPTARSTLRILVSLLLDSLNNKPCNSQTIHSSECLGCIARGLETFELLLDSLSVRREKSLRTVAHVHARDRLDKVAHIHGILRIYCTGGSFPHHLVFLCTHIGITGFDLVAEQVYPAPTLAFSSINHKDPEVGEINHRDPDVGEILSQSFVHRVHSLGKSPFCSTWRISFVMLINHVMIRARNIQAYSLCHISIRKSRQRGLRAGTHSITNTTRMRHGSKTWLIGARRQMLPRRVRVH